MHDLAMMRRRLQVSARLQALAQSVVDHRRKDPESLLRTAEYAGAFGWECHSGAFVLPMVEEALREIRLTARPAGAGLEQGVRGRTLHILTEAYPVGGHTRLVRRWIELMDDDAHAVVLVRQRHMLDSAWLVPEGRDVPIIDLLGGGDSYRVRAERLAGMMGEARRVILHIHPDDAVAVAAAHQVPGMDLRLLNHADHVAWLGAALPSVFLNLRQAGVRLGVARRGISLSSCDVVPIPILEPLQIDRGKARAQLGVSEREVLLLTVATGYKYLPIEGRSLESPLSRALEHPEVRLMAIGPGPEHPLFGRLAEQFPGRVQALGVMADPSIYRAAADIYLDSYPFCSPTSMLESAVLGTPVVSLQPNRGELEVLYSECPGLPKEAYAADDEDGYQRLLEGLLSTPGLRETRYLEQRNGMAIHLGPAWRNALSTHLDQTFDRPVWEGSGLRPREDHLDTLLAGLGQDPRYHPKLKRWMNLGIRGPLAVLRERIRTWDQ
jgi:glycosyltransferase involved in cell wall biosynthesis